MKKLIGYCGLDCQKCDAYIATQTNDQALREKTAKLWSKLNNVEITPEMINCDGCRTHGRKTPYCEKFCQIKICAQAKKMETCGSCSQIDSCQKVAMIFSNNSEARNNLQVTINNSEKQIEFHIASADEIEDLMNVRLEMLKVVNNLPEDYQFDKTVVECSRKYFLEGNQTTILAKDGKKIIGCASICYITVMPTCDHPTGKRAHLMNVYTNKNYKRSGIGKTMVSTLIEEAGKKGCSEISLDATSEGRLLYEKLGFISNEEGMILRIENA